VCVCVVCVCVVCVCVCVVCVCVCGVCVCVCVWFRNLKRWGLGQIWVVDPQKKNVHPLSAQNRLNCSNSSIVSSIEILWKKHWIWTIVSEENIVLKTIWHNAPKTVKGLSSWVNIAYSETFLFCSCCFTCSWISEQTYFLGYCFLDGLSVR